MRAQERYEVELGRLRRMFETGKLPETGTYGMINLKNLIIRAESLSQAGFGVKRRSNIYAEMKYFKQPYQVSVVDEELFVVEDRETMTIGPDEVGVFDPELNSSRG